MDQIVENLAVVRPTFMAGPPRIFEKVHAQDRADRPGGGRHQVRLFSWAFTVGQPGLPGPGRGAHARAGCVRAQYALADRLVLSKIRDRLGGRIRFLVSGSAALSQDIASWFHAAGLVVIEGYALTETGGGACIGGSGAPGVRRRRPAARWDRRSGSPTTGRSSSAVPW